MDIDSPLSNLCNVLYSVKRSATVYSEMLRRSEEATRAVLIDPILRSLGWDTGNPFMVEVEKYLEKVTVDYALCNNDRQVAVLIDAKCLGSNLSNREIKRIFNDYMLLYGQLEPHVLLTDGLIWRHYQFGKPSNFVPGRVLNLIEDDVLDCAAYFVQHMDAAKFWHETAGEDALNNRVNELRSVVSSLQADLDSLRHVIGGRSSDGSQLTSAQLVQAPSTGQNHHYKVLDNLPALADHKPVSLRLPDGSVVQAPSWNSVLREACKFALANNPSIQIPFPDKSGRSVNLFSARRPPTGISYAEERYCDRTIYIYTNYDSGNCVANASYILSRVPSDKCLVPAGLLLQPKEISK